MPKTSIIFIPVIKVKQKQHLKRD